MTFEWTVPKIFVDLPEREYINNCCVGCDDILAEILPLIASEMAIDEKEIDIYQEDWGWAMEFTKDDVFYFLGIGKTSETENETIFTVNFEANRKVKGFIFSKKIEAAEELKEFSEIVSKIAQSKRIEII